MTRVVSLFLFSVFFSMLAFAQGKEESRDVTSNVQTRKSGNIELMSNFGIYYKFQPFDSNDFLRIVLDWGIFIDLSDSDAFGASVFISDNFGPELHYRRRLSADQSVDVAVGVPLWSTFNNKQSLQDGVVSLHSDIKFKPYDWFGIAIRPELRRKTGEAYKFHLYGGIEFDKAPGAIMSIVVVAGIAVWFISNFSVH